MRLLMVKALGRETQKMQTKSRVLLMFSDEISESTEEEQDPSLGKRGLRYVRGEKGRKRLKE
jgi:hypothetical protein